MKRIFVSTIFLILLLNVTPTLSQETEDDDKFEPVQVDVLDAEDVIESGGGEVIEVPSEPVIDSLEDHDDEIEPQEPLKTEEKKEIHEETEKALEQQASQATEKKPETTITGDEPSEAVQENNNNNKQPDVTPISDENQVPEPTTPKGNEEASQTTRNEEPPKQQQQTQHQPSKTGGQQNNDSQRGRPTPQGQPGQARPGQPAPQGNQGNQNQQNQPKQQGQVPPSRQPNEQNQQIPQNNRTPQQNQETNQGQDPRLEQKRGKEAPPEPDQRAYQQQQQPQQPSPSNNRDVGQRNIEIGRQKQQENSRQDAYNEEDYLRLIGATNSMDYLDHYKVYSESFYNYVEGIFREGILPLYRQIRANPYLSMGASALVCLYALIFVTRLLGGVFRRKPKFRYNKEETISQSDINNNFKKFITELDNIKKQISTTAGSKGNDIGGSNLTAASIPQGLQDNISFIAQGLTKNEDVINKMIRDKNKLDNFLVEFQKEVVESHKAIWNELYQLRKVFSQGRINLSTSTGIKPRTEPRESDETKSLSSNPEMGDKRREEARPVPNSRLGGEPRSKSVTPNEPGQLRSRQPLLKDKRPAEVDAERRPSFPHPVNGQESGARLQREEEPKAQTPVIEKGSTQSPFPFKQNKEEEQPGIQIPTNVTDKSPSHNPFAQSGTMPNQTNLGTPGINVTPKTIPFGNPRAKPAVIKGGMPNIPNQTATNPLMSSTEGIKPEKVPERKTSLDIKNGPFQAHAQNTVEQATDKIEETKTAFENEPVRENEKETQEEPQIPVDDVDSESTSTSKQFVPPFKGGPIIGGGPLRPGPGKPGPIIPGNKGLPVPQVRRTGPPGANVFRGPPGNLPKPGGPTQIKQPSGPIIDGQPKSNTQV